MMLAIPRGHEVFTPGQDAERDSVHTELRHFLNWGTSLGDLLPHAKLSTILLRDMWLLPNLTDRLDAMLALATVRSTAGMDTKLEGVMRELAWDIAHESGMNDAVVLAATKLTLAVHRDGVGVDSEHTIVRAISVLLARCEYGYGLYRNVMSTQETKARVMSHLIVCLETLEFICSNTKYGAALPDQDPPSALSRGMQLADWLPDFRSQIILLDSLGASPMDILREVKSAQRQQLAVELPALSQGDHV
jgi:hypothetical protein